MLLDCLNRHVATVLSQNSDILWRRNHDVETSEIRPGKI
jgi:hypothetical protein